ncbi:MAG: DUF1990 domain-containing protein, partial [Bacteroidota bacterium]
MPQIHFQAPDNEQLEQLSGSYTAFPLSYSHEGMTKTEESPPRGYRRDDYQIRLGEGEACFLKAKDLIRNWTMFDLSWVRLHYWEKGQRPGQEVTVCFHLLGSWWTSPCRVVYLVDEAKRFGFAYG